MTAINQPTITRIELSRPAGKKKNRTAALANIAALLASKKYRLVVIMASVIAALLVGCSLGTASLIPPVIPTHFVNPIGSIHFTGNGRITEHLAVHGLQVRLSATLQGDELTTTASSKFGSHTLTRAVPNGNLVIFAVPNGTSKPLVLTTIFNPSN
jgi:hypothetical protein